MDATLFSQHRAHRQHTRQQSYVQPNPSLPFLLNPIYIITLFFLYTDNPHTHLLHYPHSPRLTLSSRPVQERKNRTATSRTTPSFHNPRKSSVPSNRSYIADQCEYPLLSLTPLITLHSSTTTTNHSNPLKRATLTRLPV
jgi:hypothetical protein